MRKKLPIVLSQHEILSSVFGHQESEASSDSDNDLFGWTEVERGASFEGF